MCLLGITILSLLIGKAENHQILPGFAMIKLFCKLIFEKLRYKTKLKKLIETEIISKDIFEVVFRNTVFDNKEL